MWSAFKGLVVASIITTVMSFVVALPIWFLWNEGPFVLGLGVRQPSYWSVTATILLIQVIFAFVYFVQAWLRSVVVTVLNEL